MKHMYIYAETMDQALEFVRKNRLPRHSWSIVTDPAKLYVTQANTTVNLIGSYKNRADWPTIRRIMEERRLLGAEWS